MPYWRENPDGVTVAVKVQPKSRRPGIHRRVPALDGERLRIGDPATIVAGLSAL